MSEIQTASRYANTPPLIPSSQAQAPQPPLELPAVTTELGLHISAESAYLFAIDKYLTDLDRTEQAKALEFLARSQDLWQNKAAEYFKQNRESLQHIWGGDSPLFAGDPASETGQDLLNTGFVLSEATAVVVQPFAVNVFRLEAGSTRNLVEASGDNRALKDQLDVLEATAAGVLGNQDRENLFGSVRHFLSYSEHTLLSFDGVLHFNYALAKAQEAIRFVAAPQEMKSALTDILSRSIVYQNEKQTQDMERTSKFVDNARIGDVARESLRLGTAAQDYQQQLQAVLNNAGISVLDAKGPIKNLLAEHTDLIRFPVAKLDEAIAFYKSDYARFERALRKDFANPVPDSLPILDMGILALGTSHALTVIEEIQNYISDH